MAAAQWPCHCLCLINEGPEAYGWVTWPWGFILSLNSGHLLSWSVPAVQAGHFPRL